MKKRKNKTVMLFGTFDIVHLGHLRMFKEARKYGEKLVVIVARDANVKKNKGKTPFHLEKERKKLLEYIDLIDEVRLGDKHNIYKMIGKVKPDIIALGYDQKVLLDNLVKAISNFGLKIRIVRLKPFQPQRYKNAIFKKYIEQMT